MIIKTSRVILCPHPKIHLQMSLVNSELRFILTISRLNVCHNLRVSEKDTYKVSLAKSIVPIIVYVSEELKVNASIYIPWCAMKNA